MVIASTSSVEAKEEPRQQIDIPASRLPQAIAELSRETAVSIGTEGALPQLPTPAVHGRMGVAEALARLLAGSGYVARQTGSTAWRIERAPRRPVRAAPTVPAPAEASTLAQAPIIVTAAKRRVALDQLPMALSVVRLSDARRANPGSDTAWVASEMDGMTLTGMGSGRNRIFLRGIADSAFNGESQSTVAVLLDDARLTYSAPDPDIRLVDVDRVEVLEGPQGSLYGVGAMGGIYHIVTHHADLDTWSLTESIGAKTLAQGNSGLFGSAIANMPLIRHRAALRLVGYTVGEPGWVDTGKRTNSNSGGVLGGRAELGVDAGNGWRLDVTGFVQFLNTNDSQYVYQPHARSRPAQRAEPHDNDLRLVSARLARHSGGIDILLSTAMTWHNVDSTFDATVGAGSFGLPDPQLLQDQRHYRVWDNEARLNGKMGSIGWLAGLSHVEAKQVVQWTLLSGSPGLEQTIDDDRRTTSDSAAFGDITFPLLDRVKLDLGGRLFRSDLSETRVLTAGPVTREQHRTGVTPSAALSWRPRPGRLIFLRYGSAFRQGGTDIGANGQLQTLKSDKLTTIEIGWREELGGGGRLDAGANYSWWDNLQSDVLQPDGLIETENAGDAEIAGVEVSLDMPLAAGWRLWAGGTFVEANLVRNTLGYKLSDRHLPVVPKYTVRGAVEHQFRLGRTKASVKLELRYLGPARLSFDPVLDRPMGDALDSRIEANAAIGGFNIAFAIDNVLNGKADTFAFGNPLRFSSMRQYTPQKPLTASLSVSRHF